ncbi:MAG TPA: VCBS repeat-containing protein [Thermoanaerobaculia bacterium]|nr:VCBS repeat-containing protein [Thermoanaerobaculia bacterium]
MAPQTAPQSPRRAECSTADGPLAGYLAVALVAAAVMGCATASGPQPSADASETGQAARAPATPGDETAEAAGAAVAEEEREWLVDEEGREYYIVEAPKRPGEYRMRGEDRVHFRNGPIVYIAGQDEDTFYVKIFRVDERPAVAREAARPRGDDQRPEPAVAAPLEIGVETVDRLRLVPIGAGLPSRGQWRNGFEVVDFDGDGHLDVVHGPPRKGGSQPRIFLGDGAGGFRPYGGNLPRAPLDYGDVAVADFDGDGTLDLAFASHLRGFKVLVQSGGGWKEWSRGLDFRVAGGGNVPPDFTSRTLKAVDWDGDGRIDLVTLGEGPRLAMQGRRNRPEFHDQATGVRVFLNNGDGSWSVLDGPAEQRNVYGDSVAVGDLDGDGRPDLIHSSLQQWEKRILAFSRGRDPWETEVVEALHGWRVVGVDAADYDGDGRDDFAVGAYGKEGDTWRSAVLVALRRDDGWDLRTLVSWEGALTVHALASGDVDGDGHRDLVALVGDTPVVMLGDGRGGFVVEESPEAAPSERGCNGSHLALADLDGDGRDEIVVSLAGESGIEHALIGVEDCPSGGGIYAWKAEPR